MGAVDIPRQISALYRALHETTTIRETLDVADELRGALGQWIQSTRAAHHERLAAEEREHKEIAEIFRRAQDR